MSTVKQGDKIKVHYTGKMEDGSIFDSSENREPLEFTVGSGMLIKGFDDGVVGMNTGETKTINIPAEEAYGAYNEEMVFDFDRSMAPQGAEPEIGEHVQLEGPNGEQMMATIIGKTEAAFIMDCNHPLAGKNLIFEIKLVEIAV